MKVSDKELNDLQAFTTEIKGFLDKMEAMDKNDEIILESEISSFENLLQENNFSNNLINEPTKISFSNDLKENFENLREILGENEKNMLLEYQKAEKYLDERYELKLYQLEQVLLFY